MARRVTKNTITAIVAALLLVLVAPWLVPAGAYRTRIESSLSNALSRAVTVGAVHFRLLPRPGLSFSNLTIGEDPAFGAESMLFAAEVSADLRLAALGQGRLEFSSLSLRDASFNLVRRDDGEWNVQSLMARASRAAPAGRTAEARPRFPYLEATLSRVNFKYGIEKKAFALADADFALWMEPGAQAAWHGRLRARPMRADANLSDTGILTAQATFVRTSGGTPQLLMEAAWEEAQLGQSSALFFGRDRGWRGSAAADLAMAGPLDSLALTARFSVSDFHRYDIRPAESLRLAAVCTAKFLASTATLAGLGCKAASGDGAITVRGDIRNLFGPRNYRLRASAEEVPLERLVAFARNAKKDLPADLTAEGNLTGELSLVTDSIGGALVVSGSGIARQLTLRSAASETTLPLEAIAFDFGSSALESQMQASPQ